MASRSRLRTVDFDGFDPTKYSTQHLFHGESCAILGSFVPAGMPAYRHHRHEYSDQLYYVVKGTMQVQLGSQSFSAGPDTLVYIPQGMPHHNWNDGDVEEFHLEVIAPCPFPSLSLATPTDDEASGDEPFLVRPLDPSSFIDSVKFPGFSLNRSIFPVGHSDHVSMYVGEVAPGAGGPGTHIHAFDQFYFVLSGVLSVEVGFDRFDAGPGTLVTLPAGVPHRQWNEGGATERHLALLVPNPEEGKPLDLGVVHQLTGEAH
jgi:mannose-6-phosphate isomerase-like protein (cupin superfamily)